MASEMVYPSLEDVKRRSLATVRGALLPKLLLGDNKNETKERT